MLQGCIERNRVSFKLLGAMAMALTMMGMTTGCQQKGPVPIQMRPGKHSVEIAGHKVYCMIAADPAKRQRGLMYRSSLPDDEGMLFVFPEASVQGFWMKNCLMDMDIAYIDDTGKIVDIITMKAPAPGAVLFPRYRSSEPVRYALETNPGWFAKRGIEVGETVNGYRGPGSLVPR